MATPTTDHMQTKAGTRAAHARAQVRLCGRILSPTTVVEVVNMLSVAGWDGELQVRSGRTHYRLTIAQGALKTAASDADEHRLGELLVRRGLLTREQLGECLRELGRGRRIGEVLIDKGWIERTQLFAALRAQTERIFRDAVLVASGRFLLTDAAEDGPAPPISFHLPLQSLLLEAAQRVDEMRLFRTRIQGDDVRPVLTARIEGRTLDPQARSVASYVDGERSIREIADRTALDEYHVTRAIYALIEQGLAAIAPERRSFEAELGDLVDQFDGVLQRVLSSVAGMVHEDEVRRCIADWIAATGLSSFVGPRLLSGGTLDRERMLAAVVDLEPNAALAAAHQVLHDLTTFALFAAGPCLTRQQESELARDVYRGLRQIALPTRTPRTQAPAASR